MADANAVTSSDADVAAPADAVTDTAETSSGDGTADGDSEDASSVVVQFLQGTSTTTSPDGNKARNLTNPDGSCAARLVSCCRTVHAGKTNLPECSQLTNAPPEACQNLLVSFEQEAKAAGKSCK